MTTKQPRKSSQRKPYRVLYQHPGQPEYKNAHIQRVQADSQAAEISRNGAVARVVHLAADGTTTDLAVFGPDQEHLFTLVAVGTSGALAYQCSCPALARDEQEVATHLRYAGKCSECWGDGRVTDRATRTPIECPVCQGTGEDSEVSFHDVDTSAYYSRAQLLSAPEEEV